MNNLTHRMGHACLVFALAAIGSAQVSDFVLTNDFGWSTYPPSPTSCPDWVVSGKNVGTGTFYAGCGLNVARDANGSLPDKHTLTAWYKANVFSDTNPGGFATLNVWCNVKVTATASVDLSHAEEPGGANGTSKGWTVVQGTRHEASAARSTIGNTTNPLSGTLEDGWRIIGERAFSYKWPNWVYAGGQYRTLVTLVLAPSGADCLANSPSPNGCLVESIGSGKSHYAYVSHSITGGESAATPQATLTLSGFEGAEARQVDISYFDSTGTTEVYGGVSWVSTDGLLYAGTRLATGTYDIYVHVRGFLRKKFNDVSITNGVYSGLTATLVNGDANNDNAVDIGDYSLISANLNLTDSDSTWERMNADSVTPKDCDLNGDGAVDIADYAIVSANYNQEGD